MNRFLKEIGLILVFALIMTLMAICLCSMWDFGVRSMFANLPELPYIASLHIVWGLFFISIGLKFCVKKIFEDREDDDE